MVMSEKETQRADVRGLLGFDHKRELVSSEMGL